MGHGFGLGPTLFHGQVVSSPQGQISFIVVDLSCSFPRLDLRRPRRRDSVFNIAAGELSVGRGSFNVVGRVAQLSAQVVQRPLLRFSQIDIC